MFRRRDGKNQRWSDVMERRAADRILIRSKPDAIKLTVVDNGDQGWKWLAWDYDPDGRRMAAGAVEGSVVPHGIQSGFANLEEARAAGIAAVRRGGWSGLIVLEEPSNEA